MSHDEDAGPDLTVVIPSYNSVSWLPSTLEACAAALSASPWTAEVVVVDDGSTDGTEGVVRALAETYPVPLKLVKQENKGRFLARWAGLQVARGERVLLLDSRVVLGAESLAHLAAVTREHPEWTVWNGHAVTDPTAPLVGHFWEVITHVFWGGYLADPRPVDYGSDDFNRYPKGTTFFLARRQLLIDACQQVWPAKDAALTSDDTKLIRRIAAEVPIHLDPEFRAVYRPRGNVRDFVRHSFGRGTFLVDSFAGTSTRWNTALALLALAPPCVVAVVLGFLLTEAWEALAAFLVLAVLTLSAPAALAARRGCPRRGIRAYLVFVPVFVLPYWIGLLRGIGAHGHLLRRTNRRSAMSAENGS